MNTDFRSPGLRLGSLGTEYFGEQSYPRHAAVIMQYTGLDEVYGNEPPTYNCVGTNDGIASFKPCVSPEYAQAAKAAC